MPLVWRGFGIIVPILFFIVGFVVSLFTGEGTAKLGNPTFMGWTTLVSGILLLLIGLAMRGGKDEDGNPGPKHDFFYIPVFIWGIGLTALSLYLLLFTAKAAPSSGDDDNVGIEVEAPTTRMLNIYNPSVDTIRYIIADETKDGLIEGKKLAPNRIVRKELAQGTYMLAAFGLDKKSRLSLPTEEDAKNGQKFKLFTDDKGSFYQRIWNPATADANDYDEAWLVIDGKTNLMLVNLEKVSKPGFKKADLEGLDFASMVEAEYPATDLIEPLFGKKVEGKKIKVFGPGDKITAATDPNEVRYTLAPHYQGYGVAEDVKTHLEIVLGE